MRNMADVTGLILLIVLISIPAVSCAGNEAAKKEAAAARKAAAEKRKKEIE